MDIENKKYVICRPRLVCIGKNCALGLGSLKTSGTRFPNTDQPRPENNIYIFNWSTIFILTKSLLNLNRNTVILYVGNIKKIGGFYYLCLRLLWLVEMFTHKENYLSEYSV